ncbi:cytochrome P450 3A2-like [Petaurus breviceps papuanus]|uniref:cytochrome P450 3A2-like n=1 Tax=Petaurus breviceps papuanus TaxID=3040969 RepID=UPI0036D84A01
MLIDMKYGQTDSLRTWGFQDLHLCFLWNYFSLPQSTVLSSGNKKRGQRQFLPSRSLQSNGGDNLQMECTNKIYTALSDEEILAQSIIFLFAGYETTSFTLSCLAYNLVIPQNLAESVRGDGCHSAQQGSSHL